MESTNFISMAYKNICVMPTTKGLESCVFVLPAALVDRVSALAVSFGYSPQVEGNNLIVRFN